MAPQTDCWGCDDQVTCPHTELEKEALARRMEDGSVTLAFQELVTLLREAHKEWPGDRLAAMSEFCCGAQEEKGAWGPVERWSKRAESALARWAHLPDFTFDC